MVSETSTKLLDIYSFSHITHGVLYFLILVHILKIDFWNGLILSILFEIIWEKIENTQYIIKKYRNKYKNYRGDTNINIFGDILCSIIGYILSYQYGKKNINILLFYILISEILLYKYDANLYQLSIGSLMQ